VRKNKKVKYYKREKIQERERKIFRKTEDIEKLEWLVPE